jgi:hypothetical protein
MKLPTKLEIPQVPMALVTEYAKKIKPLVETKGVFNEIISVEGCNPFTGSFLWHHRIGDEFFMPEEISMLEQFCTLHTFGAPSMFHPSMEEVIAQIPRKYLEDTVGFTIEWMAVLPTSDHQRLMQAGMHVARLTIYGYADVHAEPTSGELIALPHEVRGEHAE